MPYKIIFFDIDGTLVDDEKKIPQDTKEAVLQVKESGMEVVIATGRAPYHARQVLQELGVNSFICFNGSYVVNQGKAIHKKPLDSNAMQELEALAEQKDHPLVFMGSDACFANREQHPHVIDSFHSLREPAPEYRAGYWRDQEIYQALLYCQQHEEPHYSLDNEHYRLLRWHPYSMDVIPARGSKADGIAAYLQHVGLTPADAVAFGDGLNDREMLSFVGMGVAMGNAHEGVKSYAKMVTKNNDAGGISSALKELRLI